MTKGALIIGGSVAGLQAALDLADSGIKVHLVESSPFLASNVVAGDGSTTTLPGHLLNTRLLEATKHPNVTVWTNTRVNRAEGQAGRLRVELRRHPRYVDLTRCTACGDCVQVCPVAVPGTDHQAIHLGGHREGSGLTCDDALPGTQAEGAPQPGCAAIDKLGKAPCSNTCPGNIHVQGYVALIAQGRFQEAIDLIRAAIPFPGICGRICTHPCEINCRRAEIDKSVAIRLLKRFVSDWELETSNKQQESITCEDAISDLQDPIPTPSIQSPTPNAKQVAIVGAGPGGMAVANTLARLGYRVSVFERLPVIGGMMAVGIPEYRLPRDVIAREYQNIQDLGIDIRLNTAIGPEGDLTLDDLFNLGYEAVCLAIGAHKSHALRIPGEDLPGVVQGIELLKTISLSQRLDDPQYKVDLQRLLRRGAQTRTVILGGGNTAMDVSRSLRRFGLKDVRILYRRTRNEMPAMPEEIEDAEKEGVKIQYLISPVRILGTEESGVTGLECVRMKLGEPDASGRRRPVPLAGSEFVVNPDLVVPAIGQAPDLDFLGQDHGIAITRDERINVSGVSFMTSRPGVFAAGDAVTSDKMAVIEAIGMGKIAAAEIDAYLKGQQPHEMVVDAREVPIARREMTEEELAPKPRLPVPTLPMKQRLASFAEVEVGYTAEQAKAEAQRCLVCGPCSECLACERVCKPGAVVHEQQEAFAELDVGAIIYADTPERFETLPLSESDSSIAGDGLYRVPTDDPLLGSAAAARAMFDLFTERQPLPAAPGPAILAGPFRIGVFVCQCGEHIAKVVDTEAVRGRAATWPGVVHAQVLPFSCSPEAAETINDAVAAHHLNRVVLAACSCCAIDQVCYSCTYQRVRCKTNLGIFPNHIQHPLSNVQFEFVNIREQCAWIHASDPSAATAKATALVAAAVANVRTPAAAPVGEIRMSSPGAERQARERSVLILGSGAAARTCRVALTSQGIDAAQAGCVEDLPLRVWRAGGQYVVAQDGTTRSGANDVWQASALVLAPRHADEAQQLLAAFGEDGHRPRTQPLWGGVLTHRPGVLYCDPVLDPAIAGAAAAARAAAWLGRAESCSTLTAAVVDPARCRACSTCVQICEFGAPQLMGEEPQRTSWIDPTLCTGCGTCVAHCPSGAITAGSSMASSQVTDTQLDALLKEVPGPKALVLTCNWNAYSGMETAGAERFSYSPAIRPLRVTCLGRLSPGIILKAFEKGADGVLLLGCPPGECHHEFGNRHVEQIVAETKEVAALLGFREKQLKLDWVAAGEGVTFTTKIQEFVTGLDSIIAGDDAIAGDGARSA